MSEEKMKLIDTNAVTELLGISKSTLYRWCNLEEKDETGLSSLSKGAISSLQRSYKDIGENKLNQMLRKFEEQNDNTRYFPRPYQIGRAYKWNYYDVIDWIKEQRK